MTLVKIMILNTLAPKEENIMQCLFGKCLPLLDGDSSPNEWHRGHANLFFLQIRDKWSKGSLFLFTPTWKSKTSTKYLPKHFTQRLRASSVLRLLPGVWPGIGCQNNCGTTIDRIEYTHNNIIIPWKHRTSNSSISFSLAPTPQLAPRPTPSPSPAPLTLSCSRVWVQRGHRPWQGWEGIHCCAKPLAPRSLATSSASWIMEERNTFIF